MCKLHLGKIAKSLVSNAFHDPDLLFFLDSVFYFCPLLQPCAPDHLCALNTLWHCLGLRDSSGLPMFLFTATIFYQISLPDWHLKIWRPYFLTPDTPYPISCFVFFSYTYNFINGVIFILMCSKYSTPRNVLAYTELNTQWRVAL